MKCDTTFIFIIYEPTVTSDGCQGNACSVSASHKGTSALPTKHSWEGYIHKICDAATAGKSSFPYPDDNRYFIKCNAFGAGYISMCPNPLVWNDKLQTCDNRHVI